MIPVPERDEDAAWTNLAPGATVSASSSRSNDVLKGLNDRRALKADAAHIWSSQPGAQRASQWVKFDFAVPVAVRTVRLYAPAKGVGDSDLSILEARVVLFDERGGLIGSSQTGRVRPEGTEVAFTDVVARSVRVEFRQLSGSFMGSSVAALSEVEVIARGAGSN